MENTTNPVREDSLPGEIVETYCPPDYREVVLTYSRPLPGQHRRAVPAQVKKRRRTGLWVFLGLLAAAAVTAGAAWIVSSWQEAEEPPSYTYDEDLSADEEEIRIPTYPFGQGASLTVTEKRGKTLTPQEIYAQVNPAVVTVMAQMDDDGVSVGTGVIFTEDGYILTNYHVVEGGLDCLIMLNNDYTMVAQYVAGDRDSDLAVLKCEAEGLPTATFGTSHQLTVGDPVYAIGNPLGVELRGTFTNGIVSAIDRDMEIHGRQMNLIQTNAALNSGNSGGPLIDQYGRVVGINVIKMTGGRHSATVEGLGFSIPTASAERIVNDLLTYGEVTPEPRLGVSVLQIGQELASGVWGVQVVSVIPDSAADQAGVRVDDFVIGADGQPIRSSSDVLRARRKHHVGDQMVLTVWRDGKKLDLTLDLTEPNE